MFAYREFATLLDLPATAAPAALEIVDRIEEGLPLAALDRLAALLAPGDAQFRYRIVPKATLDRRKTRGERLSPAEGARVARLARVWAAALEVWKDEGAARRFLSGPHMMLGDRSAVDVTLQSEFGAEAVLGILGRLVHGTAA